MDAIAPGARSSSSPSLVEAALKKDEEHLDDSFFSFCPFSCEQIASVRLCGHHDATPEQSVESRRAEMKFSSQHAAGREAFST